MVSRCRPEENRMWTGAAIQDQLCMREMESGICIIQRRILQTQDTGKTGDQYSVLHMRRAQIGSVGKKIPNFYLGHQKDLIHANGEIHMFIGAERKKSGECWFRHVQFMDCCEEPGVSTACVRQI